MTETGLERGPGQHSMEAESNDFVGELRPVGGLFDIGSEVDLDEVKDRSEDPVRHQIGIAVANGALSLSFLDVYGYVGDNDLLAVKHEWRELLERVAPRITERKAGVSLKKSIDALMPCSMRPTG